MREAVDQPGRFYVTLRRCGHGPFCIPCAPYGNWVRKNAAFRLFQRCTPAGKEPRFNHVVQNAPVDEKGNGWGTNASEDIGKFAKVVWEVLGWGFGDGLGALMTYHDFGERAFGKRHPHYDLTLNGWKLGPDGPEKVAPYELRAGGHDRWQLKVAETARKAWPGVYVEDRQRGKPMDFSLPAEGFGDYEQCMDYQLREIVDLRKIEYSRTDGLVSWKDYRSPARQQMTIREFVDGLHEYDERLGAWGGRGRRPLDRGMGHLSDRRVGETEQVMGREGEGHPGDCQCGRCARWERAWPAEAEMRLGPGLASD